MYVLYFSNRNKTAHLNENRLSCPNASTLCSALFPPNARPLLYMVWPIGYDSHQKQLRMTQLYLQWFSFIPASMTYYLVYTRHHKTVIALYSSAPPHHTTTLWLSQGRGRHHPTASSQTPHQQQDHLFFFFCPFFRQTGRLSLSLSLSLSSLSSSRTHSLFPSFSHAPFPIPNKGWGTKKIRRETSKRTTRDKEGVYSRTLRLPNPVVVSLPADIPPTQEGRQEKINK